MKQRERGGSVKLKMLLAAASALALAVILVPTRVTAQVTCPTASTADSDGDGFTDAQECAGITLNLGTAAQVTIPACVPGMARSSCVDPNSKDVFVIAVRANPSLIPADPYKFVTGAPSAGGLGITVHEVTATQVAADRTVMAGVGQKAARLQESLDTSDQTVLGSSNQGIALDLATTFTQRITNLVNTVCVAGTTCIDANFPTTINTPLLVAQEFIRHDIAHELGHSFALAPDYNAKFGGNHYQAGSNVVLEQNVTYTKKGTKVTWYISVAYTSTDQAGAKLQ
jgi:hypothetical protein